MATAVSTRLKLLYAVAMRAFACVAKDEGLENANVGVKVCRGDESQQRGPREAFNACRVGIACEAALAALLSHV